MFGVFTDICIVIFTRDKIKSTIPLVLLPIAGGLTGMFLPEKIAPLCLLPGIPLFGYGFALLLKSKCEEEK